MKGFLRKGKSRTEIFFTGTSELCPLHKKSRVKLKKKNQNANLGVEISVLNLNFLELFQLSTEKFKDGSEQVTLVNTEI